MTSASSCSWPAVAASPAAVPFSRPVILPASLTVISPNFGASAILIVSDPSAAASVVMLSDEYVPAVFFPPLMVTVSPSLRVTLPELPAKVSGLAETPPVASLMALSIWPLFTASPAAVASPMLVMLSSSAVIAPSTPFASLPSTV